MINQVPKGATHRDHTGLYWDFPKSLVWVDGAWQKDTRDFALIFIPLALLDATHKHVVTGDFYKKVGTYWEKWLGEWVSAPFPPIDELRELNK